MDEEEFDGERPLLNGDVINRSMRGIVDGVETFKFGGGELDNESAKIGASIVQVVVVMLPDLAGVVVLSTLSRR